MEKAFNWAVFERVPVRGGTLPNVGVTCQVEGAFVRDWVREQMAERTLAARWVLTSPVSGTCPVHGERLVYLDREPGGSAPVIPHPEPWGCESCFTEAVACQYTIKREFAERALGCLLQR